MEYQTWAEKAKCRDADPEVFHPSSGNSIHKAFAICEHCPVKLPCREYGIINETTGVWGGWSGIRIQKERTARGIDFSKRADDPFINSTEKAVGGFVNSEGVWVPDPSDAYSDG